MQSDFTFATRLFKGYCIKTQTDYPLIDRMVRRGRRFYLIEEPGRPGDVRVERRYTPRQVFEWLREMPEQIKRAVLSSKVKVNE